MRNQGVVRVDEDLLYVFRVNGGWLMVCGALRLVDAAGARCRVRLQGSHLAVDAA
jgi:hypothetical protein